MAQRNSIGIPAITVRNAIQDQEVRRALDALAHETTRWLQRIAEAVDNATGLRGEATYNADVNANGKRIKNLGTPIDEHDAQIKGLALGRETMNEKAWDARGMPIINLSQDVPASQNDATLSQEQIRDLIREEVRKLKDTLIDESYIVVANSALLTNERALAAEVGVLNLLDAGANSSMTVNVTTNGIGDTKIRQGSPLSVIGRSANSSGNVADIAAIAASDAVMRESGNVLGFGTVATAGIADNAVTNAKIRDSSPLSVIGRSANSSGDPADIAAVAASDAVLRESGNVLGFGTVATAGITDNAVTDQKLRDSAALSVIGRSANSSGDPADIAAAANGNILRRSANVLGFGQIDLADATNAVANTLAVGNGGTGATTFTADGVLYGNAASAIQVTAQGGTNTVLTANAGAPSFSATPTVTSLTTTGAGNIGGDLNHDGSNIGLNGVAPTARSTGWSVANVTEDKTFDADATSTAELADVLGTLITYLILRGDLGA